MPNSSLKCNESDIHFKLSVAYNNKDVQPHGHYCPQIMSLMMTIGHSFPGNDSTPNVVITANSIHLEWSMVPSAMWKPCNLAPLWGNPIHQKPSQAWRYFGSMLENWHLTEDQGSILMSLPGLNLSLPDQQTSKLNILR